MSPWQNTVIAHTASDSHSFQRSPTNRTSNGTDQVVGLPAVCTGLKLNSGGSNLRHKKLTAIQFESVISSQ